MDYSDSDSDRPPLLASLDQPEPSNSDPVRQRIEPLYVQKLYEAKDNLRRFVEGLGDEQWSALRDDVLEHCERVKGFKSQAVSYERIEKMVKNRIQKMIKNKKIKKNWSEEDISILVWVISKYADSRSIPHIEKGLEEHDWHNISTLIPGVDGQSCMFKWLSLRKNRLSDYSWSEKQSTILDNLVKKYNEPDWIQISQQLYYMNSSPNKVYRCPKQCREHWNCYLNPNLKKGPWSTEEDIRLLSEIRSKNGGKKWADMVRFFNGRTENALKNRYNLIIDKERGRSYSLKKASQMELVCSYLERNEVSQYVCGLIPPEQEKNPRDAQNRAEHKQRQQRQQRQQKQTEPKRILRARAIKKKTTGSATKKSIELNDAPNQLPFPQNQPFNALLPQSLHHQLNSLASSPNQFCQFQNLQVNSNLNLNLNFNESSLQPAQKNMNKQQQLEVLGDLHKIKIVPVNEDDMLKIKQFLLSVTNGEYDSCSFVPCKISHNKLTKLDYQ